MKKTWFKKGQALVEMMVGLVSRRHHARRDFLFAPAAAPEKSA
jgi:hypothetical protein